MDISNSFSIAALVARFEHYAKNHKSIKHDPAVRRQNRFFHLDLENLQEALTNGANFPALFLQTPDVEKNGAYDNMSEHYDFTFIVVDVKKLDKANLFDAAKTISDAIYNRLLADVANEVIPGMVAGTTEGMFGPVGDGLYGWAVSCSISNAYSAELSLSDWGDLS